MTKTQKPAERLPEPERDPIPTLEHGVLSLFEGPLSGVGFPGIDRATLAAAVRSTLDAQLVVEAAERDLEHSRRELSDRTAELGRMARRALAYARVLAEDDPALADAIEALAPRATEAPRATRKRRARPDATAMLPTLTSDETDDEIAAE